MSRLLFAAVLILGQVSLPRASAAQGGGGDAIRWQGTVKYTEIAQSPDGHRVKNVEVRFELITPLRSTGDVSKQDTWQNVMLTWADSGRWHNDEHEVEEGTVPESNTQWNVSDGLTVPSGTVLRSAPSELHTNTGDGSVQEVWLPTLPLRRVGSKVLVQPNGVGLRLVVTYRKAMESFLPRSGIHDRVELHSTYFAKQPAHVPGEGIAVGEANSDEYAGLPPEVVASLKMMEAATADVADESEEDQVAITALRMDGYVNFDGSTVSGSRTWTTSAQDPGEYAGSIVDDQTVVSHELSWTFAPVKTR